jgi:nucleoside 2-deoxyribosyltransferase
MESAWTEAIHPGIEDAECQPVRIDKVEHNEKICDRIVSEIRGCGFLVADVTGHRQGVYFEAGLALGLGKQVIWTCRKNELDGAHFDTRQYNHIVWEHPADLRVQLRDRIKATIVPHLPSRDTTTT